jgi:protein TonB
MKPLACAMLLYLATPFPALAQSFGKSNAQTPYEINISAGVAEKLLVHKEEIQWHHAAMEARVMGTVVVDIEINAQGNVTYVHVISGPKMLRQPVLDAVRKYKYKPYLLNGKPVEVESSVSVTCQCCPPT